MVIVMWIENVIDILLRSLISLVVLFIITECMGKKQLNQLNLFDYIIGISIGSIAATLSVDRSVDYLDGIISIVIYGLIATLISYLTTRSILFRRFFTGVPLVLMNHGKIIYNNLKKSKLDLNDFLQLARENGYYDISQVNCAILEPSGRVSFLAKSKYLPLTPNDDKLKVEPNGLVSNLIIDGKLMKNNIKRIGHDEKWVLKRLENLGYKSIDDILLVTCNLKEEIHVFLKESVPNNLEILE